MRKPSPIIQLNELTLITRRIHLNGTGCDQILINISDKEFHVDFAEYISIYLVFDRHRFAPVLTSWKV